MPQSLRALTIAEASSRQAPSSSASVFYATLAVDAAAARADETWRRLFGGDDDPFARLSPADRHTATLRVAEAAAGAATNQFFLVEAPDDHDPLPVLLQFYPVYPPGKRRRTAAAVAAVGEVLSLSDEEVGAHMQRERVETIGRMALGITHDFNNLLSGILGHTELVRETFRGSVPALVLSEYLRTVSEAALDGAALIQRYIRREAEVRHEPLDLVALLEGCLLLTRPYWYNEPRRRGAQVEARLTADEDVPPVLGTAYELREVFTNLILNALHAMPGGGRLTLRVALSEEDAEAPAVVVAITDTGSGMAPDVLERIFEPLYTTKGDEGTGMGLAVAHGVIRKHGGSIEVESEPGEGTTFTIRLPPAALGEADRAPAHHGAEAPRSEPGIRAAAAAPSDGTETSAAIRVLVVDDEPAVRSIIAKLLKTCGYAVEVADSGAAALALLGEADCAGAEAHHGAGSCFDILFTDQCMPEMSGRQLARAAKARFEGLPVVLLSGDTELGGAGDGVDVVLGKPFRRADLDAVIRQLVRG